MPTSTLTEGGYVQLTGETGWWRPSSRVFYSPGDTDTAAVELAAARAAFFAPRRAVDPFGAVTHADFDGYSLLPVTATDPVGNVTSAASDYRVLLPATVTDPNGNRVAAAFDVLGQVTATAVMGKTSESLGDLLTGFAADLDDATLIAQFTDPLAGPAAILGNATSRFLYDLGAYQRTATAAQPSPPACYTLARETHVSDLTGPPPYAGAPTATKYQYHFGYCDGFGRQIQRKAQVAPGPVVEGGPQVIAALGRVRAGRSSTTRAARYAPTSRSSRRPAPSSSPRKPASPWLPVYDPPGRVVATLHPDNSWDKVVFGPWSQQRWDGDDTALISDPRTDADVGGYFTAAARHRVIHLLVRPADRRDVRHDGAGPGGVAAMPREGGDGGGHPGRHASGRARAGLPGGRRQRRRPPAIPSRTAFDTEGKPLAVFDPLGRRAAEYCYRAPLSGGGFQYLAGADMAGARSTTSAPTAARGAGSSMSRASRSAAGMPAAMRSGLTYDPAQRPTAALRQHQRRAGNPHRPVGLRRGPATPRPPTFAAACSAATTWPGTRRTAHTTTRATWWRASRQLAADYHAGRRLDAAGWADDRRPARRRRGAAGLVPVEPADGTSSQAAPSTTR